MAVASCFCVFSTSKTFADLAELILKRVAKENGADPKKDTLIHMVYVLITTNVIGAGFSIDWQFSHWFGFFFTGILAHGEEWQFSKHCRFKMKQFLNDERQISLMYIGKYANNTFS